MFDPYHKWLGIPEEQQPPSHYQLLGVDPGETDPEVIAEMAIRQTSHVRTYQTGPHAEECRRLLNEIAQARRTLLDPARRRAYDQGLRRTQPVRVAAAAPPVAAAVAPATVASAVAPAWALLREPPDESGFADLPVPIRRRLGRRPWHGVLALVIVALLVAAGALAVRQVLGEAAVSAWWPEGPPASTAPARAPGAGPGPVRDMNKHDPSRKQRQGARALAAERGGRP
jgi:hypothetical protein